MRDTQADIAQVSENDNGLPAAPSNAKQPHRHALDGRMVVPPQWNMTPSEYRALVTRQHRATAGDAAYALASVVVPLTASILLAWAMINTQTVANVVTDVLADALNDDTPRQIVVSIDAMRLVWFVGTIFVMFGLASAGSTAHSFMPDMKNWLAGLGHHPSTALDTLDPAAALSIEPLPDEIAALLYYLADDHGVRPVPSERAERLLVAYECTMEFSAALVGRDKPTIATLVRECPEAMERLLAYCETPVGGSRAFSEKHRVNTVKAIKSALTITRFNAMEETAGYANAVPAATKQPTDQPMSPAVSSDLSPPQHPTHRWADAIAKHDRITDAWADIITDPLAALDHSLLLDVTQPRTAKFIEVYGRAQDLRSLHGTAYPGGTTARTRKVVADYLGTVRQADEAWTDAMHHARHVHLAWLPDTEAKRVRQASALLATAADESQPMHLRADAAAKAAQLLAKVTSFYLPPATATAIEVQARLALPAGPTAGGGILSATSDPKPVPRDYLPMDGTVY